GTQGVSGMQGPEGITQGLPAEQDHIGLSGDQDLFGLGSAGDQSHRPGWDTGFSAGGFRKANLEPGADWYLDVGDQGTGGDINQIDIDVFELFTKLDGLLQIPTPFYPVAGGDAHQHRQMLRPGFRDGLGLP